MPASRPSPADAKAYWASIQDENGLDLTLIRSILELPPIERIRRADKARRDALRLMELGKRELEPRTKSA